MNKHLLFLSALIILSSTAIANHFSGAYLRYEQTDTQYKYNVYLTLYKTCESSAIDLPTFTNIVLSSASQSTNTPINIPLIKSDTLNPYCSGTSNSCTNISSPNPGYIIGEYKGTFTIPTVANDWKIVFANSNRNLGISNLQGASGQGYYIESTIDLNNSSTMVQDPPPHVILINDTMRIPLSGIDADGDDIRFELVEPVSSATIKIPYQSGYSLSQPFGNGGVCYIDSADNLVMLCPNTGKYTLSIKVSESRNAPTHSYSLMDFVIICISPSSSGNVTVPYPTIPSKDLELYTCPGKKNSVTLNYIDNNTSDSIYLNIQPPTLNGWSFNTNIINGVGSATATLSWTTPPTINPSNLKFFDFVVNVRDNSCLLNGKGSYVYRVNTRECAADSVWPGDANADKVVNIKDPLAIAIAYNDTGALRSNANLNWVGQSCDSWNEVILNNIDTKHTDCNGDGTTDTSDLVAVSMNYSKTHQKRRTQLKTTAVPDLYFDHSGISPNPDSTVSIKINLGTNASPIENFYGLGTNIQVVGLSLNSSPTITYPASWLGDTTNTLRFMHNISNSSVDWAYSRIDKQNITSDQGTLANIIFTIPSNAVDGQLVKLYFNNTILIDKDGVEKNSYNTHVDSFYIVKPSVVYKHELLQNISIYPNPTTHNLNIHFNAATSDIGNITIADISGQVLYKQQIDVNSGKNRRIINVNRYPSGLYTIAINTHNSGVQTIKWRKL